MYKHILVPTDGSKLSGEAVTEAVKLAATCGAKITLLHVVSGYRKAMSETDAVAAAMARRSKRNSRTKRRPSRARLSTPPVRWQRRRGLQGFLLGSETSKALCHTKIPVLVVR